MKCQALPLQTRPASHGAGKHEGRPQRRLRRRRGPQPRILQDLQTRLHLTDGRRIALRRQEPRQGEVSLSLGSQSLFSFAGGENLCPFRQKALLGSPMISTTGPTQSAEIKMWEGMAAKGQEAPKAPEDKHVSVPCIFTGH